MKISVITATYNRRDMLRRLFESLLAQNYDELEWIIIDDGSGDGTDEAVAAFKLETNWHIRYFRQANSGKNVAVNFGLDVVQGDLVSIIDDDDYFLPDVFHAVATDYSAIADNQEVAGLSYLTLDSLGKVWGKEFPRDRMISDHFRCRINQNVWGDKCEFTKASVLRDPRIRFCVSEVRGGFAGDTVFHLRIAEKHKVCYVNTAVIVKNYYENGITVNWRRQALQNPSLTAEYYAAHLDYRICLPIRFRYMVAYAAIMSYSGQKPIVPAVMAPWTRTLFALSYLPGMMIGARWRRHNGNPTTRGRKHLRPAP